MTWSPSSNQQESEVCPKCGGPIAVRPRYGQPVWLTLVFGLSFLAFLFLADRLKGQVILQFWTAFQLILGLLLVRARLRAKIRVSRCIRCGQALT